MRERRKEKRGEETEKKEREKNRKETENTENNRECKKAGKETKRKKRNFAPPSDFLFSLFLFLSFSLFSTQKRINREITKMKRDTKKGGKINEKKRFCLPLFFLYSLFFSPLLSRPFPLLLSLSVFFSEKWIEKEEEKKGNQKKREKKQKFFF